MEKPKSEKQIRAEFNLANDPTEFSLYTTTRGGPLAGYNEEDSQLEKYGTESYQLTEFLHSSPMDQSQTQSPLALWSAGGHQEILLGYWNFVTAGFL